MLLFMLLFTLPFYDLSPLAAAPVLPLFLLLLLLFSFSSLFLFLTLQAMINSCRGS
jgi:hypothetical protein